MQLHVVDHPFPATCNFFLEFSVAKLLWYNELLSRIETENTKLAKYDLSLSANVMVYHISVCAMVCIYAFELDRLGFPLDRLAI